MQIMVDISDEDVKLIQQLLDSFAVDEFNTHGKLDLQVLAGLLLEDAALAWRRPGSWEGANMLQVLSSHGYQVRTRA
ncbi:MAG: hypothetical protein JWR07_65 [Nevskia sp.]|nr:hypothetical protein [Nevskia sp.]